MSLDSGEQSIEADSRINRSKARITRFLAYFANKIQSHHTVEPFLQWFLKISGCCFTESDLNQIISKLLPSTFNFQSGSLGMVSLALSQNKDIKCIRELHDLCDLRKVCELRLVAVILKK